MRIVFLLFLVPLLSTDVFSQEEIDSTYASTLTDTTINYPVAQFDSSQIEVRAPDPSVILLYSKDPAFTYGPPPSNERSTFYILLSMIFNFIFKWLSDPLFGPILRIVFFITLIFVFIALLNQWLGGSMTSILIGRKSNSIKPVFSEEELREEDLDARIKEALTKNQYDLATRYIFLKSLKLLSNAELILWSLEKTNHDYQTELRKTKAAPFFSKLALYYEYAEYGDFDISRSDYDSIEETFNQLNKVLPK